MRVIPRAIASMTTAFTLASCSSHSDATSAARQLYAQAMQSDTMYVPLGFATASADPAFAYDVSHAEMMVASGCRHGHVVVAAWGDGTVDEAEDMSLAEGRATRLSHAFAARGFRGVKAVWFGGPRLAHPSSAEIICVRNRAASASDGRAE